MCDSVYLHGVGEHASQSERDLLWELLPRHGNLKTVSKINVQDASSQTVQHQVGGVPGFNQSECTIMKSFCHVHAAQRTVVIRQHTYTVWECGNNTELSVDKEYLSGQIFCLIINLVIDG